VTDPDLVDSNNGAEDDEEQENDPGDDIPTIRTTIIDGRIGVGPSAYRLTR
jgi:hypothetical protein